MKSPIPTPLFQEFQHGFKVTLFKSSLDEGVTRLLILIRQNPGQRAPFFETATGSPRKTIERWLKQLKEQSEIEFRGAPRTGGYFTTNKNQ